jgi:poly-gamma-glutamate synthesis protein (capsule biosynthesis protein)
VRRWLGAILLATTVVVAALVVAATRDGQARDRDAGGSPPATARRRPATTTTTTRPPTGSGRPVTLAFGGDVHFEGNLRALLASNPGGMFADIAGTLGAADLAMVNLETAIATGGTPDEKAYNFRAPPAAFEALRAAGVDVVTMANNHGRDYGADGLAETLAARAATPLPVVGIGADAAEAYRPWRVDVRGQRIAVLGASDVVDDWLIGPWSATDTQAGIATTKPGGQERLVAAVAAVRPQVDTVVVYLHWGAEGDHCPTDRQRQLAQVLVDAGADVVVGSHAHRVQGGGRLGSALVDYGLGNFAFYNEAGESGVTGVLRVTVTGRRVDGYEWLPARISGGVPHLVGDPTAASDLATFAERRDCAGLTP